MDSAAGFYIQLHLQIWIFQGLFTSPPTYNFCCQCGEEATVGCRITEEIFWWGRVPSKAPSCQCTCMQKLAAVLTGYRSTAPTGGRCWRKREHSPTSSWISPPLPALSRTPLCVAVRAAFYLHHLLHDSAAPEFL